MPADAIQMVHLAVNAQKPLCLMRRFEPPHLAFLFASVFMRHFGTIVGVLVLAMDNGRHHLAFRCGIAPEFVRSHFDRNAFLAFQQLPEEARGGEAYRLLR